MKEKQFLERLNRYPALKQHIEEMLEVIDNPQKEIVLADEAEDYFLQQGRRLN